MEFNTIYGTTVTKELVEETKHLILESEKNYSIDSAWFCNFSLLLTCSNDYESDKLRKLTDDFKSDPSSFNFRQSSIEFDKRLSETIEKEFLYICDETVTFVDITNSDNKRVNKNIISNKIKTPDGTIIESRYKNDFVEHNDKNGRTYSVDGGDSYLRRKGSMEDCEELSTFLEDGFDSIRDNFTWGSFGKSGSEALSFLPLKEMTIEHINNVLISQTDISDKIRRIFNDELNFRSAKSLTH